MSERNPIFVRLRVYNSHNELIRQTKVEFTNSLGRQFIAKTAWWAMHNGHTLITNPISSQEHVREIKGDDL
jgi:hypothetical protein